MTGTNAIGTAMIEGRAVEVRGAEHFLRATSRTQLLRSADHRSVRQDRRRHGPVRRSHGASRARAGAWCAWSSTRSNTGCSSASFPVAVSCAFQRDAGLLGTVHEGIVVFDGERWSPRTGMDLRCLDSNARHRPAPVRGIVRRALGRHRAQREFCGTRAASRWAFHREVHQTAGPWRRRGEETDQ
jgi:hypothetical protein